MRFSPLFLYKKQQTGSDELGNPISELTTYKESEGMFSSWTTSEIALDSRSMTVENRKIITKALKADLLLSDKIKFDGKFHTITEIKGDDYSRWRILIVNRYGSEEL